MFKDNILLALNYLDGRVKAKEEINWDEVKKPFHSQFTLWPSQEFAFHEKTLADYSQNVAKTTNAHFIGQEGFKSDYSPSNHNFAKINDVPKEYGVGILSPDPLGNLYIINNRDEPVTFSFDYDGVNLTVAASVD